MMVSKIYCPLPFMHMCLNPTGYISLCCEDSMESCFHGNKCFPFNEIESYLKSDYLSWVRNSIEKETPLKECTVCYQEENKGLTSKRQYEISKWGYYKTAGKIKYLDLKFGNLCNLQCFSCDPSSSSKIAEEYISLGWNTNPPYHTGQMGIPVKEVYDIDMNWYKDIEIRKQILQFLPYLSMLKITGGEPFLNPFLEEILEEIVHEGLDDIQIQITTNGTVKNHKLISLLQQTNSVIVVSIDGVGLANNLIRYPSHFDEIADTIRTFRKNKIQVRINTTFSVYNIFSISDVFDFADKELGNRVTVIPLFRPEFLNPACLPTVLKEKCIEKIQRWREKATNCFANYYSAQINQQLYSSDTDLHLFEKFIDYTLTLCSKRNIDIKNHLPELAEYLHTNSN